MGEIRFVGLDVHKESIAIAVAEQAGGPPQTVATVPHELRSLLKQLKKLASAGPIRCCYEAGPTGFALRRALPKEGIECVVIAPSLTPKQPGDRVKTDRRDAEKLARFYRSGDLTEVHVPDETTEAVAVDLDPLSLLSRLSELLGGCSQRATTETERGTLGPFCGSEATRSTRVPSIVASARRHPRAACPCERAEFEALAEASGRCDVGHVDLEPDQNAA